MTEGDECDAIAAVVAQGAVISLHTKGQCIRQPDFIICFNLCLQHWYQANNFCFEWSVP